VIIWSGIIQSVIPVSNDHNQETGWAHLGSLAAKMLSVFFNTKIELPSWLKSKEANLDATNWKVMIGQNKVFLESFVLIKCGSEQVPPV
jgi:hypothetical protein